MKSLLIVAATLLSFNAFAEIQYSNKSPLFTKTQSPGFAPPQFQNFEKCEVYRYQIIKTQGVGQLKTVEYKRIKLDGPSLRLMTNALNADQVRTQGPTDIPSTTYSFGYVEDNETKRFVFSQKGTRNIETNGQAAQVLKNFINKICK